MGGRGALRPGPGSAPDAADALMETAARYLATRPRTRFELERRLRRSGADAAAIDAVLERLARLGYVDDIGFARWWAEQRDRHAPRGRRLLEAELRQHGVSREAIEAVRDELAAPERPDEDAVLPASDEARARAALERHLRGRPLPDDPKALQRVGAFLVRRGFDAETVRATLRAAATAEANDEW